MNIQTLLADEFNLTPGQAAAVTALIDDGDTIPFIARYRKEATGGVDDATLREFYERLLSLRSLEARKDEVRRLIGEQLTPELRAEIDQAQVLQRVEDLYKPYRKKRTTRATRARAAGLEPLALTALEQQLTEGDPRKIAEPYINAEQGYPDAEAALAGAGDIIAGLIADDAEYTALLRDFTRRGGSIVSTAVTAEKTAYETYRDFSEPIGKIPNHRVLALNRGEKEGQLRVKVRIDADQAVALLERRVIRRRSIFTPLLQTALTDAYKRLIAPALEREMRNELTERAEAAAIRVFARNAENLLAQPPVRGVRVLALDPGYRTGCKVAVLDEQGKALAYTTVYPTPPRSDLAGTERVLRDYTARYRVNMIVIGNGTGSRETEAAVAGFIEKYALPLRYAIVSEAGASVYSASQLAREEHPDLDVTIRGAVSLGRRLQDPLAELVKIPPRSIGVGQYQHDINQAALERALTGVVENVVNRVGVDLNTASASLLGYVAGLGGAPARNIIAFREENGPFRRREQLKKVPRLGEKTFRQCAGFLRISGGTNPLDGTAVHPESYALAAELLRRAGVSAAELARGGAADIGRRLGDLPALAAELQVGLPTLRDIAAELEKPGRDPRGDAPPVVGNRSVRTCADLRVGMELSGTVRNVVDFGAFVDIGLKQDGLVHVSRLAERFVRHPAEVVAVGDIVTVWVIAIDPVGGKVSLTMAPDK
ncbi:MAG: RNA-binding transcriptional accessory protein [Gracilibacteraceae bacterium]|jgi:uncharacterized protein|nr:RNA-binding transcriptional accessory protein [Gracilibacteraceae bacterium]